jgi:NAD-dependent dihydropyrimidine dehydrogenase PreA subunit
MAKRKIVKIDESKCDGCGECVIACAEGAFKIIDGKARLTSDKYCDGLGACLGECPQGAITITEREADEFDEKAVKKNLKKEKHGGKHKDKHKHDEEEEHDEKYHDKDRDKHEYSEKTTLPCGCPGTMARVLKPSEPCCECNEEEEGGGTKSRLMNWPVQLRLVPTDAEYYKDAKLLLVADCVPVAYPNLHQKFLGDRPLVMGCPKLDDAEFYIGKLAEIIREGKPKKIKVLYMEVPCCLGLVRIAKAAAAKSGIDIPVETVMIGVQGDVIKKEK